MHSRYGFASHRENPAILPQARGDSRGRVCAQTDNSHRNMKVSDQEEKEIKRHYEAAQMSKRERVTC